VLAALLLVMDLTGSVETSARTEARLRASEPEATSGVELEVTPALRLTIGSRRTSFRAEYSPRVTLVDSSALDGRPFVLHELAARVEWLTRHGALWLEDREARGTVNFASMPLVTADGEVAPRVEASPAPRALSIVSSTTTLGARWNGRRGGLLASAGFARSGGVGDDAREVMPYASGPFSALQLTYTLSPRDRLATTIAASATELSSGPESRLLGVEEGLSHRWSRSTEVSGGLGLTAARTAPSAQAPVDWRLFPTAELGVRRSLPTLGRESHLALALRLAPAVNRLLGSVDQRVELSLGLTHTHGSLETRGFVSASASVPSDSPTATDLLAAELAESWNVAEAVTLGAGVRLSRQRLALTGVPLLQGVGFFSVTLRAPQARF